MLTKLQSRWSNDYWERCMSILGSRYGIANPNRIHRLCLNLDQASGFVNWNWKGVKKVESAIFPHTNWHGVNKTGFKMDSHSQCSGSRVLLGYVLWINFQLSSGALSPLCFLKSNKEPNGGHQTCVMAASPHTIKLTSSGDFSFESNFQTVITDTFLSTGIDKILYSRKIIVASPKCWPLLCNLWDRQTQTQSGWSHQLMVFGGFPIQSI